MSAGIRQFPLTAQWRQILTALTEKKAILGSVANNPYAKSLKSEIDDSCAQIEALTRFAHVMGVLQRQIAVLEPVMGRKVLKDQQIKFYCAMRLLCFVMTASVSGEQKEMLAKVDQGQVQVILSRIIKTEIPDKYIINAPTR